MTDQPADRAHEERLEAIAEQRHLDRQGLGGGPADDAEADAAAAAYERWLNSIAP